MTFRFDFIDLQLFVHVAETGSMGRGAERCFLSPPAATKRVKVLEDALSVKLLHRGAQGVTLTPAGEVFLRNARLLLANAHRLHDELQTYASGLKGQVRLWTNTTVVNEFLPELLATFMANRPGVDVDLREGQSHEIVAAVQAGVADIGIVTGKVSSDELQFFPFRDYEIVVVCPVDHPLAAQESLPFHSTLKYQYVGLPESSAIHKFLENAAHAEGMRLKMRVKVGSFESICRLVEADIGISVIPKSVALRTLASARFKIVPLQDAWARRQLCVCVRTLSELPSFTQELVRILAGGSLLGDEAS